MKKMKITLSALLVASTLLNGTHVNAQQAGDVDVNWATSGWLMDDHVSNEGEIYTSIKKISNNRFMMVGYSNNANMNMILAMYNSDGTLDTTFGNQGVSTIDVSIGANDGAFDIVELWDGKILVAGSTTGAQSVELVVLRLLADGQIDNSFGTAGQVRYDAGPGSWSIPSAIAISANNNIFIGASINAGVSWDFSVMKLTQGGGFAANYGTNGVATIVENTTNDNLKAMHITATEEVIFVGNINFGATQSGVVTKLDVNGDLDPNFNTLGFTEYNNSTMNYFNDLLVDDLGGIIVTGHEGSGDDVDGLIIKYGYDGILDLPFGTNGKIVMNIGASNGIYYNQIAEKADGNYIVTGQAFGLTMNQIHAFGFDATGASDCEFGCAGLYLDFAISVVDMEQNLLLIMDDGSILTGGHLTSQDFVGENMFLTKLLIEEQILNLTDLGTAALNVVVYPNPTSEYFNIKGIEASDVLNVSLVDLDGRLIQTWNGSNSQYELDNVTTGNYILQLVTNNGTATKMIAVK